MDGDGHEDVAVGDHLFDGEVRIHLGTGTGLEPVPATVLAGAPGEALGNPVLAADVDGDGVLELVVGAVMHGTGAGAIHVYEPSPAHHIHGNETTCPAFAGYLRGTMLCLLALCLAPAMAFGPDPVTTVVGDTPHDTAYGDGVALADVNGDGYDDVFLAYIGGVELRLGGPGGVDAHASWTRAMPTNILGDGTRIARLGDVNGDGIDDVGIAYHGYPSFVEVWHGSLTGLGTVPDGVLWGPVASPGFGTHLTGADVDQDGFDDVLVVSAYQTMAGRLEIFRGSATGVRSRGRELARGGSVDRLVGPVSAGDHDGDGFIDLLVGSTGSRAATLLVGDGAGRFQAHAVAAPGENASYQVVLVDVDGDGQDEIAVAGTQTLWVHAGGTFAAGLPTELITGGSFVPQDVAGPYDVDGDGLQDVVFAGLHAVVTAFGSASGVPDLEIYDVLVEPDQGFSPFTEVDVGDVDGDGVADYLSDTHWFFEGARLTHGGTDPVGATYWTGTIGSMWRLAPTAVGDVDGDGYDDVAVSSTFGGAQALLGGPSGLTDTLVSYVPQVPVGLLLDIDGNGRLDTVVWEDGLEVYRDRPAVPPADRFFPAPSGVTRADLVVGDVDGDGHDDVVALATDDPDSFLVWYAGGPAGMSPGVVVPGGAYGDRVQFCADADGDGRCELVLERDGAYLAFAGTPTGPGPSTTVPELEWVRSARDYDNDGRVDLLGTSPTGVAVVYGTTAGWDGSALDVLAEPGLSPLAPIGDLDGDGFEDVALAGPGVFGDGELRLHSGGPAGVDPVPGDVLLGSDSEGLGTTVLAVDVDGDGVKELAVGAFAHADGRGAIHVYEP